MKWTQSVGYFLVSVIERGVILRTMVAIFWVCTVGVSTHTWAQDDTLRSDRIKPSVTDPSISRFDFPHYIVRKKQSSPASDSSVLVVFLPGTSGRPNSVTDLMDVVAQGGYRAIALAYNDIPAVQQVCPKQPDPNCAAQVREKRLYGRDTTDLIDDRPEESITHRLVVLLQHLNRKYPAEGWSQYLMGGDLNWEKIALSGLSQGAGMAAFVAQKHKLNRVILFSSPWDFHGNKILAPWIKQGTGVTPADRWFAVYHEKENTAPIIARAYRVLGIPEDQVRVLRLEPNLKLGENPYHATQIGNRAMPRTASGEPAYLPVWKYIFGLTP